MKNNINIIAHFLLCAQTCFRTCNNNYGIDGMIFQNIFIPIVACSALTGLSSSAATRMINDSHRNARLKRVSPRDTAGPRDSTPDGQQFLQAFGPLFGHPRPPRVYHEADYRPQPPGELAPYRQTAASSSNRESAVLGSGNFGVIPGGTYYAAGESAAAVSSDPYQLQYDVDNGHGGGRPHRFSGNPRPSSFRDPDDFFAGFRDFADITAPTKSSFSQYHMVYAPMDELPSNEEKIKSKTKLKLYKHSENEKEKTIKAKRKMHAGEKELYEPMIALS